MGIENEPTHNVSQTSDQGTEDAWFTPVIYKFQWGKSVTRGCFFAWIFLGLPILIFRILSAKACKQVFELYGNPQDRNSCTFLIAYWTTWIPQIILGIIWVIAIIILFFPWLLFYVVGFVVEILLMIGFTLCGTYDKSKPKAVYRIVDYSGWVGDWQEGYDPYTKRIWNDWSPVRTMCDYNCPMV